MTQHQAIDTTRLVSAFRELYGADPRVFSAPGRVNLIGEHTDYNDGFAMPMAIERRTHVAAAPRSDRLVHVSSVNMRDSQVFDLDAPGPKQRGMWLDYVEGMAQALRAEGLKIGGASLLIDSDIPAGSGLSASAALELAVGLALAALGGQSEPERLQLARAGQWAEHTYVGTHCGIMDQYISALGKSDHAMLLDCRNLERTFVPMDLTQAEVLICDTKVRHSLATSEYNRRREECAEGVALLSRVLPNVHSLRDVGSQAFAEGADRLPEVIRARCRHVVTENERALRGAEALTTGDLPLFGKLMEASHQSLRDDYEVSCRELDAVVEMAQRTPGVYGARMTGGGFGGAAVALIEPSKTEQIQDEFSRAFAAEFGTSLGLFATRACHGACETSLG